MRIAFASSPESVGRISVLESIRTGIRGDFVAFWATGIWHETAALSGMEQAMARAVTVTIPHNLGKEEARRRIEQGFGQMRQQMTGGLSGMLTFHERWEGDRLHFEGGGMGQKLSGRVDVMADSVQIQLDLPEMLASLADLITARVSKEGQRMLEKK